MESTQHVGVANRLGLDQIEGSERSLISQIFYRIGGVGSGCMGSTEWTKDQIFTVFCHSCTWAAAGSDGGSGTAQILFLGVEKGLD